MSPRVQRLLAPLAMLLPVAAAPAAEPDKIIYPGVAAQAAALPPGTDGGMGLFTLLGVLLLAGAGAWLLWRNRSRIIPNPEARKLVIAETRSLGSRQYLVVASFEGKKFLLGVCPGRIDMLTPLDSTSVPGKSP